MYEREGCMRGMEIVWGVKSVLHVAVKVSTFESSSNLLTRKSRKSKKFFPVMYRFRDSKVC